LRPGDLLDHFAAPGTQYFAKMFETVIKRSNHRLPFAYLRDFA